MPLRYASRVYDLVDHNGSRAWCNERELLHNANAKRLGSLVYDRTHAVMAANMACTCSVGRRAVVRAGARSTPECDFEHR